jgi:hypothetical protein
MSEQSDLNYVRIERFQKAKGVYDENEDDYTDIIDMLADMQHYCTSMEIDFDDALVMAREYYENE